MQLKTVLTERYKRVTFWTAFSLLLLYTVIVWNVLVWLILPDNEGIQKDDDRAASHKRQHAANPRYRARSLLDVWNASVTSMPCTPKEHVLFIKVPKCGSSTLSSIILRYGFRHSLKTALPLGSKFNLVSLLRSLNDSDHQRDKHDIFASHVRYKVVKDHEHLVPNDAFYVTIIREPLSAFKSFFNYRHKGAYFGLEGKNQLEMFFSNSSLYTSPEAARFWNRMIRYLGFKVPANTTQSTPHAVEEARQYVYHIDREFDFVIVLEYFEECLILLKRMLCWGTHEFFYTQQKTGSSFSEDYNSAVKEVDDPTVVKRYRELSYADYILYDYFKLRIEKVLENQNTDFFNEVRNFKAVNRKVAEFCQSNATFGETLEMPPSKWTSGFIMRKEYCRLLTFGVKKYIKFLEKKKFHVV
ncbi:galactosylceramide sulfotransferase [Lingula anatina]|uniref:Galactosylceramide sulfotransferase n=1 Tax=Lingula anatina TaxID=7574 RepID=A0A1S3I5N4_LINAN|nr:galactosylceramide sulfotransferase [Lingula anatina]|eukprot:XP_013393151.1 galactosylceramide sulfotransferase [Lingula anatina]